MQCTESSCNSDWWSENRNQINHHRQRWDDRRKNEEDFRCFYNADDPDEVLFEEPGWKSILGSCGFHAVFWPGLIGIILVVIVLIRRACFVCKGLYHEEHKVDLAKGASAEAYVFQSPFEPEKKTKLPDVETVDGGVYVLATGPPPTSDGGRLPDADNISLPSAPPKYEVIIKPSEVKTQPDA